MTAEVAESDSPERLMLISIHPRHAKAIIDGTKTVELRRARPLVRLDEPVFIYATAPTSAILATCRIGSIEAAPPAEIWKRHHRRVGITRSEFDRYFAGRSEAVALSLHDVAALSEAITLRDLRRHASFQPPQTWRFIDAQTARRLVQGHSAAARVNGLLDGIDCEAEVDASGLQRVR